MSSMFHEPFLGANSPEPEPGSSENFRDFPAAEDSSQPDPSGLNEKQRAAVELLAMGRSYVIAAKELGKQHGMKVRVFERADMQKLGMRSEGVSRHAVRKNDRFEDLEVYAVLADEWPGSVAR